LALLIIEKGRIHQNHVQKIKVDGVHGSTSIFDYGTIRVGYGQIKCGSLSNLIIYCISDMLLQIAVSHRYNNHTASSGLAKGFSRSMVEGLKSGVTYKNNRVITPNRNF